MKSMEISFPGSSDQIELKLVCYIQAHHFLAQTDLMILRVYMPEDSLDWNMLPS